MSSEDDDDEDFASQLPVPDATPASLEDLVDEARKHARFALKQLVLVARGKGGRGGQSRAGAARMILELSRFVGSEAEDLKPKKGGASMHSIPLTEEQRAAMKAELIKRRQAGSQQ
jgi:hypothetical protein